MIYFLRHGSTDWNENLNSEGKKDPKCQGRCDLHLNDKGKKQALEAKEYLKKLQNLYNDKIMREIYAVRYYLRKVVKQEEEISVYLKMPELEKEYLKKCQEDSCLKEINKKIIEYILLNI